jgi:hypothetical protein
VRAEAHTARYGATGEGRPADMCGVSWSNQQRGSHVLHVRCGRAGRGTCRAHTRRIVRRRSRERENCDAVTGINRPTRHETIVTTSQVGVDAVEAQHYRARGTGTAEHGSPLHQANNRRSVAIDRGAQVIVRSPRTRAPNARYGARRRVVARLRPCAPRRDTAERPYARPQTGLTPRAGERGNRVR